MNRIYSLVWSAARGGLVAVSECAKSSRGGKLGLGAGSPSVRLSSYFSLKPAFVALLCAFPVASALAQSTATTWTATTTGGAFNTGAAVNVSGTLGTSNVGLTTRYFSNAGGAFQSNWDSLLPVSFKPISGQGSVSLGYSSSGSTQTLSFSQAVTDPVLMFNYVDRATYDFSGLTLAASPITYSSSAIQGSFSSGILSITTANNLGQDGFSVRLQGNYTSASSFSISLTSGSQDSVGFGVVTLTSQLPGTPSTPSIPDIVASGNSSVNLASTLSNGSSANFNNRFDGGTLKVNQAGSYAGNFTITANNGSIDSSGNTSTFPGVFSNDGGASGRLVILNTGANNGRVILSGINTYSGGTEVQAGATLQVAADNNLGTGALTLDGGTLATTGTFATNRAVAVGANNGTVSVASGTDLTISGVVSGTGTLNKTPAGSLILSGANTHTGTLGVNQGTLVLNGSTASSVMNVSAGAVLTGSGATAGRVVLSGSVRPGNSPGTLSVAGDFTMNAGSRFDAELDGRTYSTAGGAGSHDRIALTGVTSVFTAGGQIAPVLRGISAPANNTFSPVVGDAFRVVTTANANGVDGTGFFSVTDPTAGMPTNTRFDVIYGANHIDLVLTPKNLEVFAQPYGIRNMVNAARAFDGIRPEQGTRSTSDKHKLFNGLYGLGAEPLAKTLLQASGEIHAFALSETRQGWQTATKSVGTAAALKTERNLWVDASGQNTDYKQDSRASAYETDNTQLWLGTHVLAFKGAQLGVAAGLSKRMVHTMNASSASVDTESLAIYAVGNKEPFDYAAVYSFNQSNIKASRQIGLSTGSVSNSSDSNVNGSVLSLSAGMTYALNAQVNGRVWVNGILDQTQAKAFTEQGSSVTALGVAKESINSSQATLGYTFSGQVQVPDSRPGTWTLGVGATKLLDQGSHPVTRQMSLHSAKWEVSTPKTGDSSQFLQAGVRLPVGANADAWVNLGATKRQGASGQFGNVGLSIKW